MRAGAKGVGLLINNECRMLVCTSFGLGDVKRVGVGLTPSFAEKSLVMFNKVGTQNIANIHEVCNASNMKIYVYYSKGLVSSCTVYCVQKN